MESPPVQNACYNNEQEGKELIEQIYSKYADDGGGLEAGQAPSGTSSAKGEMRWEFVQMEKVHKKQRDIYRLKCIVLVEAGVSHVACDSKYTIKVNSSNSRQVSTFMPQQQEETKGNANAQCFKLCEELDLSGNLLTSWRRLAEILQLFPALKTLRLNQNPLPAFIPTVSVANTGKSGEDFLTISADFKHLASPVIQLSLNSCSHLDQYTVDRVAELFPRLEELYLAYNHLTAYQPSTLASVATLKKLDLQGNPLALESEDQWPGWEVLGRLPQLEFLNLSDCRLERIRLPRRAEGDEGVGFPKLATLFLQYNPFSDLQWHSVDELGRLPTLTRLMLKGVLLPGARGMDSREMLIAKLPNLLELDRCEISPAARRSAELLFLSRFNSLPRDQLPTEHVGTLERLRRVHHYEATENESNSNGPVDGHPASSVEALRLKLVYNGSVEEREVSVLLSIHRLVGYASHIFGFEPGEDVEAVELRRKDGYPVERVRRLADNMLKQFDLEAGDSIAFV